MNIGNWAVRGGTVALFACVFGCGTAGPKTTGEESAQSDEALAGGTTSSTGFLHNDAVATQGIAYVGDGFAYFTEQNDGTVIMDLYADGVRSGTHAVRIHESSDCNNPGPDWTSANGTDIGDIGNIRIARDGSGQLSAKASLWSTTQGAANDVIGHVLVVHSGSETSLAQSRGTGVIACGVILGQEPLPRGIHW